MSGLRDIPDRAASKERRSYIRRRWRGRALLALFAVALALAVSVASRTEQWQVARREEAREACVRWRLQAEAHARAIADRFPHPQPSNRRANEFRFWLSTFEDLGFYTDPPGSGVQVRRPDGCARRVL